MKKLSIYVMMMTLGSVMLTSCEKEMRPCNPANATPGFETRGGDDEVLPVEEEGDGTITDGGTSSEHDKGKGKRNPRP